jgi:hypothetical protein
MLGLLEKMRPLTIFPSIGNHKGSRRWRVSPAFRAQRLSQPTPRTPVHAGRQDSGPAGAYHCTGMRGVCAVLPPF